MFERRQGEQWGESIASDARSFPGERGGRGSRGRKSQAASVTSNQLSTFTRDEYCAVAIGISARFAMRTAPRAARMWLTLMVVARSGTVVGRLVSLMSEASSLRENVGGAAGSPFSGGGPKSGKCCALSPDLPAENRWPPPLFDAARLQAGVRRGGRPGGRAPGLPRGAPAG